MDQDRMPVADALRAYKDKNRIPLHIPGHKGDGVSAIPELGELLGGEAVKCDITEIIGFDDYHEPEGIIKEAQELAAELFGADETYFLLNGTTSGIMAAVASAALEGEYIAISADCHKSVTRGIIISGADPVYINPHIDADTGLPAGISYEDLEKVLSFGGIKAVVLSNPSYYGTYSDMRRVVETAHRFGAAVIVDEAHGAHLRFAKQDMIPDAMSAGADIAVQSAHKMLGSLTQSSMMHVQGNIINRRRLAYNIRLLTSTSPSYLLMASLDAARHRMAAEGIRIWENIIRITDKYINAVDAVSGISCVRYFTDAAGRQMKTDGARILFSASELGISGYRLSEMLAEDYDTDIEFADERYALAVIGPGTSEDHLEKLLSALKNISVSCLNDVNAENIHKKCKFDASGGSGVYEDLKTSDKEFEISEEKRLLDNRISAAAEAAELRHVCEISPRKAVFSRHDLVEAPYAAGRISAQEIAVYPPGIPLVVPGEKFTDRTVAMIMDMAEKGVHLHGVEIRYERGEKKIMLSAAEDEEGSSLFKCIF